MSRLSIYAGQQGGLTTFRKSLPQVLAASWRAPDGTVAVALASLSGEPLEPVLELDAVAGDLPERGRVDRLDATGRRPGGRFERRTGLVTLQPELAPRDACLFELRAD